MKIRRNLLLRFLSLIRHAFRLLITNGHFTIVQIAVLKEHPKPNIRPMIMPFSRQSLNLNWLLYIIIIILHKKFLTRYRVNLWCDFMFLELASIGDTQEIIHFPPWCHYWLEILFASQNLNFLEMVQHLDLYRWLNSKLILSKGFYWIIK